MQEYLKKFLDQLQTAKDEAEMLEILDKLYSEGFEDGKEDVENTQYREDLRQGRIDV